MTSLWQSSSRSGLETPHFGFGLRAPEIVERILGLLRRAELAAEISPDLRHAQHRFRGDIAVVGQERGDDVDGAGALLDRSPGLSVGFHAAIDIFGPRDRKSTR